MPYRNLIATLFLTVSLMSCGSTGHEQEDKEVIPDVVTEVPPPTSLMNEEKSFLSEFRVFIFDESLEDGCREAVDIWNEALGTELFNLTTELEGSSILIDLPPREDSHYAYGSYSPSFEMYIIGMNPDGFHPVPITSICMHELGHALGLDHDLNPKSIMYPTVNETMSIPDYIIEEVVDYYGL